MKYPNFLRINHRYFSSKNIKQKCLVHTCRKLISKFYNFQFILLTFLFWTRCMQRKFQLQDLWSCALVWQLEIIILPPAHTHTHTILPQNFTYNFFLYTTRSSHAIFQPRRCDNLRLTKLFSVLLHLPTGTIISIVSFTRRNLDSIHDISFVKERVTKTGISKRLSKNA